MDAQSTPVVVEVPTSFKPAYDASRLRHKRKIDPVEWKYWEGGEQPPEEERYMFFVVSPEDLRTIAVGKNVLAQLAAQNRAREKLSSFPPVSGWYVISRTDDGSRAWWYLGATEQEVLDFYTNL